MTSKPMIEARALSKTFRVAEKQPGLRASVRHLLKRRYRAVEAVREVSFVIEEGEMVGFLGPNGAGKTTTLKMLSGLIHPTGGSLSVAGYQPERRQRLFLEQITLVMGNKQQLIWDLPPLDSIRVNAAVYGIDPIDAKRRVGELAEMLELGEELHRPVRKLSLGQRMKAELLASLLHRPRVLFLDEPTLGLDVNAQARVRDFLAEYNRRFGATVLLTSHYMGDITALCERVLLIHQGELFHDGDLEALTNKLAPFRQVRLELQRAFPIEAFEPYGAVESHQEHQVLLLINRACLTETVAELLTRFPVVDLEVNDPPIEELMRSLFSSAASSRGQER
jgi:ABC-2 type transport system ATP-binding protein